MLTYFKSSGLRVLASVTIPLLALVAGAQAPSVMSFKAFVKNSANQPLNTSGPVLIRAQYLGYDQINSRWCVISEEGFSYQIQNGVLNLRLGDGVDLDVTPKTVGGFTGVGPEFPNVNPVVPTLSGVMSVTTMNNSYCINSSNFTQNFSNWTAVSGPITLEPAGRALRLNIQLAPNQQLTPGFVLDSLPFALSISSMGATDGQILKWNNTLKAWVPSAEQNYQAGSGLTLSGNTFSVSGVSSGQLANNSVTNDKIAVGAVTDDKISSVDAGKITSGTINIARLPVGNAANTVAAGNDPRFSDSRTPTGAAVGDLGGSYPNPTVSKIQGNSVVSTTLAAVDAGKVYRWDGLQFQPVYLNVSDLKTTGGVVQFPTNCGAHQTLTWNSITDTFICTNISIGATQVTGLGASATIDTTNASNITSGTLSVVRGGTGSGDGSITGTGALTFEAGGSNQNVTLTPSGTGNVVLNGKVGIGTTNPQGALDVSSTSGALVPPRMTTGERDALSSPPNGSVIYNTTTNKMNIRENGQWVEVGSGGGGGGGRTSCPTGFTLIGTSGSIDAFCISTNEEDEAGWSGAVAACYNKDPKARLCTASEWAMACVASQNDTPALQNMFGNWEWLADLDAFEGQLMGYYNNCHSSTSSDIIDEYPFRCCFR